MIDGWEVAARWSGVHRLYREERPRVMTSNGKLGEKVYLFGRIRVLILGPSRVNIEGQMCIVWSIISGR